MDAKYLEFITTPMSMTPAQLQDELLSLMLTSSVLLEDALKADKMVIVAREAQKMADIAKTIKSLSK